jgi:plasmid stabilization system protein ParE
MKPVEIHPVAADEILEAAEYLESKSEGLSDRLLDDFFRVVERIAEYPESGFRILGKVRGARLSDFHYDIVYRVERRRIYIVALAHQSRKPGYWRERI